MEPESIFLVAIPGLEETLVREAQAAGLVGVRPETGGVSIAGDWPEVWRANLCLRGASRVLARVGSFRAMHLAQLDRRARRFPWAEVLRADVPVRVEATCHRSRIYHAGAAAERVARAIHEELGAPEGGDDAVAVKLRIDDDLATISIDTSGEPLHRRGFKAEVAKAPLRETLAALFLRQCGFEGHEPLLDPMCGSGTLVIEAAEISAGLAPGRARAFAFERLASFDPVLWQAMRKAACVPEPQGPVRFRGSDRNAGAVAIARRNAGRSGVAMTCSFEPASISDITPPEGPPGLVITNPPWGTRIGERKALFALYGAFGQVLRERFSGWRVGIICPDAGLARASGLPFLPDLPPVLHGGQRLHLWRTDSLP